MCYTFEIDIKEVIRIYMNLKLHNHDYYNLKLKLNKSFLQFGYYEAINIIYILIIKTLGLLLSSNENLYCSGKRCQFVRSLHFCMDIKNIFFIQNIVGDRMIIPRRKDGQKSMGGS